jgi:NmrA-like family
MAKTILFTVATGDQSGALVKALLASREAPTLKLFALTRNPKSNGARILKEQGVTVISGDFNNLSAIFKNPELQGRILSQTPFVEKW